MLTPRRKWTVQHVCELKFLVFPPKPPGCHSGLIPRWDFSRVSSLDKPTMKGEFWAKHQPPPLCTWATGKCYSSLEFPFTATMGIFQDFQGTLNNPS